MSVRTPFDQAKAFSDFVGFHVRLSFCWLMILFLMVSRIEVLLRALKEKAPYVASPYSIDVAAAALFFLYSVVLLFFIVREGPRFIVQKTYLRNGKKQGVVLFVVASIIVRIFFILELFGIMALVYVGGTRGMQILGLPLAEFVGSEQEFWQRFSF
jgi:hypothetical protein